MSIYDHLITQTVSPVRAEVIESNPSLADHDLAKRLFSFYADWQGGEEMHTFPDSCRAIMMPGERIGHPSLTLGVKGIGLIRGSDPYGVTYARHPLVVDVSDQDQAPNIWVLGCLDLEKSRIEWDMIDYLGNNGVRVPQNVARLKLHEIIDEKGKVRPLRGLFSHRFRRDEGVARIDCTPSIYVNAYDDPVRVSHAEDDDFAAFMAGRGISDYVSFFIDNLSTTAARMHDLGIIHDALTELNFTLDMVVTDLEGAIDTQGSVKGRTLPENKVYEIQNKRYRQEMFSSIITVGYVCRRFGLDAEDTRLTKCAFLDQYSEKRQVSHFSYITAKELKEQFSLNRLF